MVSFYTLLGLAMIMVISVVCSTYIEIRQKRKSENQTRIRRLRWDSEQLNDLAMAIEPIMDDQAATLLILEEALLMQEKILVISPSDPLSISTLAVNRQNISRLQAIEPQLLNLWYEDEDSIHDTQKLIAAVVKVLKHQADNNISIQSTILIIINDLMWVKFMVRTRSYLEIAKNAETEDRHKAHVHYRKALTLLRNTDLPHDSKNDLIKQVSDTIRENQRHAANEQDKLNTDEDNSAESGDDSNVVDNKSEDNGNLNALKMGELPSIDMRAKLGL